MQQSHKSFETFYSRLREVGFHCKFEKLEENLAENLFISNMTNTSIQLALLSEVHTPQQVLKCAINRERHTERDREREREKGEANQK